jgi:hypothetical protein
MLDGLSFDPFALLYDGLRPAEVSIGRREDLKTPAAPACRSAPQQTPDARSAGTCAANIISDRSGSSGIWRDITASQSLTLV